MAAHPELFDALSSSALPVRDEQKRVLGPGALLEVFVGFRQPPASFDLRIGEAEAAGLSGALAQLLTAGRPWRDCRDRLMAAYPVAKRQRRERFAEVIAGQRDYTAVELDAELPELRRTLAALGAAGEEELGPDRFLELLRQRARRLQGREPPRPRTIWRPPSAGRSGRRSLRQPTQRSSDQALAGASPRWPNTGAMRTRLARPRARRARMCCQVMSNSNQRSPWRAEWG